jgi:hypothetical protein
MEHKYMSHGSFEDEKLMHAEISKNCTGCIVEIGVFNGNTTRIFLENNNKVKIYGIDPIIPDSMTPELIGDSSKINELMEQYDNFIFYKDFSYNIVKNWNEKISYIFIDGDHNYNAVVQDFREWYQFIEYGGIIALHDSALYRGGNGWPGPSKLSNELLTDNRVEYVDTVSSMTIFKKA